MAAGAALIVATGGAAAPLFVAAGLVGGTIQFAKSAYGAAVATTDDEARAAWQGMGTGAGAVAGSVAGSKTALNAAGVNTAKTGILPLLLNVSRQFLLVFQGRLILSAPVQRL